MPWKEFLDGEILDASEVNDYFMNQAVLVFATETARNSAITSPNEGMFSYITDDEAIFIYKDGAWTPQLALIEDDAVTTVKILNSAVTTAKINNSAVTTDKINNTAVTEAKIGTGAVTEAKIGTGAVTEAKIATDAVTTAKIDDDAVTTVKILNEAVTTAKIDDDAVTTVKINNGAVTSAKLGSDLDLNGTTEIDEILETVVLNGTALTGTVQINARSGSVHYFTVNSADNWTWNVRADATVGNTLNSIIDDGQAITFSLFAKNGNPAFRPTSITADTSTVTLRWFGGTAPASGNANSVDCYTITFIKTADNAFDAFASQTRFAVPA
jgi:hypothetical protein